MLGARDKPSHVLVMRWTALDADNDAIGPALAMQRATSGVGLFAATRGWVAPMQNMVVADADGHIGLIAPGRVPLRRADNDPAGGFIATANQRITLPDYPHFITSEWALPYRQQRIEQRLAARPRHGLDDLAALQADQKSLAVPALLPWRLRTKSVHPLAPAALAAVAGFDGTMAADRAAPLVFRAWQRQLAQVIIADDVSPALWEKSLASRHFPDALEAVLQRDDTAWCDDRRTPPEETCAEQAGAALTCALEELRQLQGDDVAAWRWGRAHQVRAEHRPFSRVPLLAGLFELRAPVGGDTQTVNAARVNLRPDAVTGERYLSEHGPSLRALYDVADPRQSRVVHSTGQSGIVFSPHYRSFLQPWLQGQTVPLWPLPADRGGTPPQLLCVLPAPVAAR